MTEFNDKVNILAELDALYGRIENDAWQQFFAEHNIGLPMAYLAHEGLVTIKEEGKEWIDSTFIMLLLSLDVEDEGFTTVEQIFAKSPNYHVPVSF
jgi:hypothetical protein